VASGLVDAFFLTLLLLQNLILLLRILLLDHQRSQVAQTRVRALSVVVQAPLLDDDLGLGARA